MNQHPVLGEAGALARRRLHTFQSNRGEYVRSRSAGSEEETWGALQDVLMV